MNITRFTLFLLLFLSSTSFSQDSIISKKWFPLVGEVVEMDARFVYIQLENKPDAKPYPMPKKQIRYIHYANDSVEFFYPESINIQDLFVEKRTLKNSIAFKGAAPGFGFSLARKLNEHFALSVSYVAPDNQNRSLVDNKSQTEEFSLPEFQSISFQQDLSNPFYNKTGKMEDLIHLDLTYYFGSDSSILRPFLSAGIGHARFSYLQARTQIAYQGSEDIDGQTFDKYSSSTVYNPENVAGSFYNLGLGVQIRLSRRFSTSFALNYYIAAHDMYGFMMKTTDRYSETKSIAGSKQMNVFGRFMTPISIQFNF